LASSKVGNNGDEIAIKLAEYAKPGDPDAIGRLKALAEANGIWNPAWATLNVGMIRMNLGNRIRGLARKGQAIKWPGDDMLTAKKRGGRRKMA
jgi:hypothetical protein